MITYASTFRLALAASISIASFEGSSRAQTKSQAVLSAVQPGSTDGPYTYKAPGDPIGIIGFVLPDGNEARPEVTFLDCSKNRLTVKRSDLMRVRRPCPPSSPLLIWVVDAKGMIVPLASDSSKTKPLLGIDNAEIDPKDLSPQDKDRIKTAKPGDYVALSYKPDGGKPSLSFIDMSETRGKAE